MPYRACLCADGIICRTSCSSSWRHRSAGGQQEVNPASASGSGSAPAERVSATLAKAADRRTEDQVASTASTALGQRRAVNLAGAVWSIQVRDPAREVLEHRTGRRTPRPRLSRSSSVMIVQITGRHAGPAGGGAVEHAFAGPVAPEVKRSLPGRRAGGPAVASRIRASISAGSRSRRALGARCRVGRPHRCVLRGQTPSCGPRPGLGDRDHVLVRRCGARCTMPRRPRPASTTTAVAPRRQMP